MQIPIQIVRAGKTEEYVKIQEELKTLKEELAKADRYFRQSAENMFQMLTVRERHTKYYHRSDFGGLSWQDTLLLHEHSGLLIEAKGKMIDTKKKIAEKENEHGRLWQSVNA